MSMKANSQHLISWLKYLDIEYLSDELSWDLALLDVNSPSDQERIIALAIVPEYTALNEISKKSMMKILDEVASYPEADVKGLLARVGMPFRDELLDYRAFFEKVRIRIHR
jgi:hypothetical protein